MPGSVKSEKKDAIMIISLTHPKGMNILDETTLKGLDAAIDEANEDPEVKVVVLTGEGMTFVTGADVKMMPKLDQHFGRYMALVGQNIFRKMTDSYKPYIAAVNGIAFGGGMELTLACDMIYASEIAMFGQLEVNVGLVPGWGGSQRLTRMVGVNRAKEICMFGDPFSAAEAHAMGIVNKLFAPDKLMDQTLYYANKLAQKSPLALKFIKRACNAALDTPLTAGLLNEAELFALMSGSSDQSEGAAAFLEKREAKYTGK